jgi:hypothetical protein
MQTASAINRLGCVTTGSAKSANAASATPMRMPKKTTSASGLRKPATTSRCFSLPISLTDFGAMLPSRFSASMTAFP